MAMNRRLMMAGCVGAAGSFAAYRSRAETPAANGRSSLGVVGESYTIRRAEARKGATAERFDDPLVFLESARRLGAGGIQLDIGARDTAYTDQLRARCHSGAMFFEASIRLPRNAADVARFDAEVQTAKAAGATVVRTVMLSGRRYETFTTLEAFRTFADAAYQSLTLAEPIVARRGVRLAVENHKDWSAVQLAGNLKRLGSERVGACVDTGNNIALLEDPMEVVETLAPWAFTTHLKDMGVEEYEQGFLLSEVPLGEGFLDLPRIVRTLRTARPEVRFNLEMITRDPLKVPCLTQKYWATFPDFPASGLARALAMVRAHAAKRPLPRISGLSQAEKFEREDENVRRCLAYAREHLGL
jgi:sugar phosphate isomerase/epimerase